MDGMLQVKKKKSSLQYPYLPDKKVKASYQLSRVMSSELSKDMQDFTNRMVREIMRGMFDGRR